MVGSKKGFTIVELAVVLLILLGFTLLLSPNVVRFSNKGKLELDTKSLVNAIRHHHFLAKEKGEAITFSYEVGEPYYQFITSDSPILPKLSNSTFINECGPPLVLYPNGSTQDKIIEMGLDSYRSCVIIRGVTGRVRWKVERIEK